jgi:hypothetical protein
MTSTQGSTSCEQQQRRAMCARGDQRCRGIGITKSLSNRRKARLAAEPCVAIGHAHGTPFMMSVHELDVVRFA